MRLLSILLLALPVAALANDFTDTLKESKEDHAYKGSVKYEALVTHPGVAEIGGMVEVDLYSGDPNDPNSYVEVRLLDEGSEDRFLFLVDPGLSLVAVTESFAKKAGADEVKEKKVKKNSGVTLKVAEIDGFRVGDVTFGEMAVLGDFSVSSDVPVSGVLGLAAFPELASALLLSEGKLALYPAAQGADALKRVQGGAQLPYSIPEYAEHSMGKHMDWTSGYEGLVVPGQIGGAAVDVLLTSIGPMSYRGRAGVIARDKVADKTPTFKDSNGPNYVLPIALGELDLGVNALTTMDSQEFTRVGFGAILGVAATGYLNVAVDPSSKTVALSEADKVVQLSWWDSAIDETLKGLDPDPETGEAPDDDTVASVHSELSSIYGRLNQDDKELESAAKALELSQDDCYKHHELGLVYFYQGRYAEAAPHFRTAGEMWSDWDAFSFEERKQFEEDKAETEEDELEWTGPLPQSASCDAAWGYLAQTELAAGNYDAAITLFDEHGELNHMLGVAAGNAWLAKGNAAKAEAAYRQAILLIDSRFANSGLAITKFQQGLSDQAQSIIEERLQVSYRVVPAARLWLTMLSKEAGAEAAVEAAAAHAEAYPHDPFAQLAHAEALRAAGQDDSAAVEAALTRFTRDLKIYNDDSLLWAGFSAALMYAGRADEAKKAAERAIEHTTRTAEAYVVLAQLAEAEGDTAKAKEMMDQARQSATSDPAAWWLLSQN